jgi:hypothetical protein
MKKISLMIILLAVLLSSICLVNVFAQESKVEVPFTAQLPIIVTNPGQAPEFSVITLLAKRLNLAVDIDFTIGADEIDKYKTLILIIGGSGKGLGSAGVNLAKEEQRGKDLIAKARELGIKVIGMHLGGSGRRGPNSDVMVELITPLCDYVIVKADGNEDGIFNKICEENKVPLTIIEKSADLTAYLEALFLSDN